MQLVTRHFLACCSRDAAGMQTHVTIEIAGEVVRRRGCLGRGGELERKGLIEE